MTAVVNIVLSQMRSTEVCAICGLESESVSPTKGTPERSGGSPLLGVRDSLLQTTQPSAAQHCSAAGPPAFHSKRGGAIPDTLQGLSAGGSLHEYLAFMMV